jgi:hypothetical protein
MHEAGHLLHGDSELLKGRGLCVQGFTEVAASPTADSAADPVLLQTLELTADRFAAKHITFRHYLPQWNEKPIAYPTSSHERLLETIISAVYLLMRLFDPQL